MMTARVYMLPLFAAAFAAVFQPCRLFAEGEADGAMMEEVRYADALVNSGFADFAETVIAETKQKWPESDAVFFAIEVRGLLLMNKREEAEKKIATLKDREGPKYWSAKLEVAKDHYSRSRKKECAAIYAEFFSKFPKPPAGMRDFYMEASYVWGQMLVGDKRFREAVQVYERLLPLLNRKKDADDEQWCALACETAEMYLHLAEAKKTPKEREGDLAGARKFVKQLLWEQGKPVYFGKAIAMKANIELLRGSTAKAKETINDYMGQLGTIHEALVAADPEGSLGYLRLSPMPLCRYMLAEMLWKEAQALAAKTPRDDAKIADLLFGAKNKRGKRSGDGAYNHAFNVFVKYPESTWAIPAGDLSERIKDFFEKTYGKEIKTRITPEQRARAQAMMFKTGDEKFANRDYKGAIKEYFGALVRHPEGSKVAIAAVENLAIAHIKLAHAEKDPAEKESLWLDADAISGYLGERFSGCEEKELMTEGGNSLLRVAALEKELGDLARSDALYRMFFVNYSRHILADTMVASTAGDKMKEGFYADAEEYWKIILKHYPGSTYRTTALVQLAVCREKSNDPDGAEKYLKAYIETAPTQLEKMKGRMRLALVYQKTGLYLMDSAATNEVPESAERELKAGTLKMIYAIKQFSGFAEEADKELAKPGLSEAERKEYTDLREKALYFVGDFWSRMTKPDDKVAAYRRQSAKSFEEYVKQYPKGAYAKYAYVKLGTLYTALEEVEKSKDALDRLSRDFPDSDEAKNAKPRLAKALVDMGMHKEGAQVYGEMLKTDGAYTPQQFLRAGDALIVARNWDLADQAFEKAIQKAGTNATLRFVIGKARVGQAKSLFAQKRYDEARESLDLFMQDENLSKSFAATDANLLLVDVASAQGRQEKNDKLRLRHFNTAVGALKKVRGYWSNPKSKNKKPLHELDALDIKSADIKIAQMKVEESLGRNEAALEACERAAATLMNLAQTRSPTEEKPASQMTAEELHVLEQCYSKMVALYTHLVTDDKKEDPKDRVGFVEEYGRKYLELFPNGPARTEVQNCMNRVKAYASAPATAPEAPAPAVKPAAAETFSSEAWPAPAADPAPAPAEEKTSEKTEEPKEGGNPDGMEN